MRLNIGHRSNTVYNKHNAILHEIGKHREHQAASINFRKNFLESQKRSNYMNEYDRLRGAMLSGLVRESSNKYINERMGKLKELASESIHGKQHPIFHDKTEEQLTEKERLAKSNKQLRQNVKGGRIHNTLIVTPRDSKTDVYT